MSNYEIYHKIALIEQKYLELKQKDIKSLVAQLNVDESNYCDGYGQKSDLKKKNLTGGCNNGNS